MGPGCKADDSILVNETLAAYDSGVAECMLETRYARDSQAFAACGYDL